jgi:hypothetical protein
MTGSIAGQIKRSCGFFGQADGTPRKVPASLSWPLSNSFGWLRDNGSADSSVPYKSVLEVLYKSVLEVLYKSVLEVLSD